MYSASISKTLQFEVKQNFTSQFLNVIAYSDFKNYTFKVSIVANSDDDDDRHDDNT